MDVPLIVLVEEDKRLINVATENLQGENYNVLGTDSYDQAKGFLGHDPAPYALVVDPVLSRLHVGNLHPMLTEANDRRVPRIVYTNASPKYCLSQSPYNLDSHNVDFFVPKDIDVSGLLDTLKSLQTRDIYIYLANADEIDEGDLVRAARSGGLAQVGQRKDIPLEDALKLSTLPTQKLMIDTFRLSSLVFRGSAQDINEYCEFVELKPDVFNLLGIAINYHVPEDERS